MHSLPVARAAGHPVATFARDLYFAFAAGEKLA